MINPFKETNWNPGIAERRTFARSLIVGFPILAAVLALVARLSTGGWKPGFLWLAVIGCAVGAVLWLLPQIAKPFYLVWYFAACSMGIVVSNLLLTAFYYFVITPVGLFMRALGRDPMKRRFDRTAKTYWREAEKGIAAERYFRQF